MPFNTIDQRTFQFVDGEFRYIEGKTIAAPFLPEITSVTIDAQ